MRPSVYGALYWVKVKPVSLSRYTNESMAVRPDTALDVSRDKFRDNELFLRATAHQCCYRRHRCCPTHRGLGEKQALGGCDEPATSSSRRVERTGGRPEDTPWRVSQVGWQRDKRGMLTVLYEGRHRRFSKTVNRILESGDRGGSESQLGATERREQLARQVV